jgi:hypothetical protein
MSKKHPEALLFFKGPVCVLGETHDMGMSQLHMPPLNVSRPNHFAGNSEMILLFHMIDRHFPLYGKSA